MKKLLILLLLFSNAAMAQESMQLWYKQPARRWEEALPVGNGRMGAMVYGRPEKEILQVNEESVWAGVKFNDANPNAYKVLDTIRQLLFEGKNQEALTIAQANFLAVDAENSTKTARAFRSYQTLMNVNIHYGFSAYDHYKRSLDLNTGIAATTFTVNGVEYKQEVLASAPDNVIVVHITASKPGSINAAFSIDRPDIRDTSNRFADCRVTAAGSSQLVLNGQINDKNGREDRGPEGLHMKFAGMLQVSNAGGSRAVNGQEIKVKNANTVTLYIQGATNYNYKKQDFENAVSALNKCKKLLQSAAAKSYANISAKHVQDLEPIMERVSLRINGPHADDLPTDERLLRTKQGIEDPHLISLFFQYGRYLLVSSSRAPGVLPANLQGIWNQHLDAPWNADFHTNINLQMNYWPAEVTNISFTTAPLFDFMDYIRPEGRITAKKMYNARGWVVHHCTDAFGKTGVQNGVAWGTFPMAASWMCLHFWEHFAFTLDYAFLKNKAYPVMKEHALFVEDYLVKSPEGYLVTSPGSSPENQFVHPVTGKPTGLTYGPTMDSQILREFLGKCIAAAKALRTDSAEIARWESIIAQLPPTKTGKDGRILEWMQEYQEVEPGHRHISHLFGLHPGTQITEQTPALYEGALRTLTGRLAKGGGHTGWSRAWIINFYARLKQADSVRNHLQALFAKSTLPNLFDNHPPFQIDGNFGATAGIAEALLQSHGDYVELLPAVPAEWTSGEIKGLCARGGFVLDIAWENGTLSAVKVHSTTGRNLVLKYRQHLLPLTVERGKEITVSVDQLL
ncbi:glycoside hydrolase N-terminal domain-containing protein [Chitinophaga sp. GCM10012297]|uniref:Glycoside hydrolase family 95 protein n=1 Tax=Chitinophaga chungangae TaxID=2821488 RepID=A0ABS3Y8X1_9BACT|nr:glycoside hydrolase family 95 protein [Chitinophaga chungangae]MBO9151115.1 glycoside hydrolase family 95 protein [Chitinophaga chungangae]